MLAAGLIRVVGERYSVFVDPLNGSDSNSGRSDLKPYLTIARAVNRAPSGSDIWLLGGTYPGETIVDPLGTRRTDYATIRPYPGHTVIPGNLVVEPYLQAQYDAGTLGKVDWLAIDGVVAPTNTWALRGRTKMVNSRMRSVRFESGGGPYLMEDCDHGSYDDLTQSTVAFWAAGGLGESSRPHVTVRRTTFRDSTLGLVQARYFEHVEFEDCVFSNVDRTTATGSDGRLHSDGVRTYCLGEAGGTFIMRRCLIKDIEGMSFLIKDGFVNNVLLENVAIFRTVGSGFAPFKVYDVGQLDIVNFTTDESMYFGATDQVTALPLATVDNLRMFNTVAAALINDGTTITAQTRDHNQFGAFTNFTQQASELLNAPSFENTAADDYRLAVGEPGIGAGVSSFGGLTAPTVDINAVTRSGAYDLGAFQR